MKAKFLILAAIFFGISADSFGQQRRYKYRKGYRKPGHVKVYRPAAPPPPASVTVSVPTPPRPRVVKPPTPPKPPMPPAPPRPPLPGGGK